MEKLSGQNFGKYMHSGRLTFRRQKTNQWKGQWRHCRTPFFLNSLSTYIYENVTNALQNVLTWENWNINNFIRFMTIFNEEIRFTIDLQFFPQSAILVPLNQSQTRILNNSFGKRPFDVMLAVCNVRMALIGQ